MRRIGLWGAPGSGKTTYLAALNVALARAQEHVIIVGVDDDSTEFLTRNTNTLTSNREFPPATAAQQELSWTLVMPTEVPGPRTKFGRRTVQTVPLQFNIDLLDAPGGHFRSVPGDGPTAATAPREDLFGEGDEDGDETADGGGGSDATPENELIDHLASCDGIVFLFDPIREQRVGDAYEYFQGTLLRMAQRRFGQSRAPIGKLPQHVAVCVTKFDNPEIYRRAKLSGYRTFDENDPRMFPRVQDDSAAEFFAELCMQSDLGNADLVSSTINHYFQSDRVRYFITSAIGFYLSKGARRFREQDYQNVAPDGRIRGAIHPINVVEPLMWLARQLTANAG